MRRRGCRAARERERCRRGSRGTCETMSCTPFREGVWSAAGTLSPGSRADRPRLPARRCLPVACALHGACGRRPRSQWRVRAGFAPVFPSPSALNERGSYALGARRVTGGRSHGGEVAGPRARGGRVLRDDGQPDAHLHAPRRRRRDAPRRHEPRAEDAPADRGLRHRRRAQRPPRRRARHRRPARAVRRLARTRPERPLRRRRRRRRAARRRPHAPARDRGADDLAGGALRRGQRDAQTAALVRDPGRDRRRPRSCTSAAPSAAAPNAPRSPAATS